MSCKPQLYLKICKYIYIYIFSKKVHGFNPILRRKKYIYKTTVLDAYWKLELQLGGGYIYTFCKGIKTRNFVQKDCSQAVGEMFLFAIPVLVENTFFIITV